MEQAEAQGIEHLDELCLPKEYEFGGNATPVTLRGCGNSSMFAVPYGKDGEPAKVCAVDDDMGRWPRFGGDRFAKQPGESKLGNESA